MTGLCVAAARLWLPTHFELAAESNADERDGYLRLPVSTDLAAPEMAVVAADKALGDAGIGPERLGAVIHAWIYHQGHDFWSPAHYVAAGVGAVNAVPLGVQQMCNGGAAGIQIAADRMAADPSVHASLITTADRFAAPAFDRWRGDYGVCYGDGATALVLSRERGPYTLTAMATAAAPALERMHRGDDSFSAAPREQHSAVDIRRTKKAFLTAGGGPGFTAAVATALRSVIEEALDKAGLKAGDPSLRLLALPRLGLSVLDSAYLPALQGLTPGVEFLDFGRETGHLGAGDAAANLAEIHAKRLLAPGESALLLSAGAGFTWSCLVIRAE
jgi:3-oxoacyl-[acyl-carrier-protein] synthase-3